jgi:kynurenine formamidase
MISVDGIEDSDLPIHRILMARDMVIVENLTRLDLLPDGPFLFSCLPLAIRDADGSPIRAVAMTDIL